MVKWVEWNQIEKQRDHRKGNGTEKQRIEFMNLILRHKEKLIVAFAMFGQTNKKVERTKREKDVTSVD